MAGNGALAGFVCLVLGRVVQAPGGIGGQCVDLANLWLQAQNRGLVHLNAVDWAGRELPGLVWQANMPYNYPEAGDLVVWRMYPPHSIGQYGHIAVCVTAGPMHIVSLDQNWPEHDGCDIRCHDYGGVAGWHTAKQQ